jgi:hypothetical protein
MTVSMVTMTARDNGVARDREVFAPHRRSPGWLAGQDGVTVCLVQPDWPTGWVQSNRPTCV